MAQIVIGDDLYSHVPFVEQLQQQRQHYVLVAKPSSHPTLVAAVAAAEGTAQSQTGQWSEGQGAQQRAYTYRLVRQVPLALESAVRVNFLEVWERKRARIPLGSRPGLRSPRDRFYAPSPTTVLRPLLSSVLASVFRSVMTPKNGDIISSQVMFPG